MKYLPLDVWGLKISYLSLNDLIEFSCLCKDFYRMSRNDSFHVKKLNESKRIFKDKLDVASAIQIFVENFTLLCLED